MYQSVGAYCSNHDNFAGLSYIGIAKAADVSLPTVLPGRWNPLPTQLDAPYGLVKLPFVSDTAKLVFAHKRAEQGRIIAPEINLTLTGQSAALDDFLSAWIGIDLFVLVKLQASGHARAFRKMRLEEENDSGDEPAQFTGSRLVLKPLSEQLYAWKGAMPGNIDDTILNPLGKSFTSGFSDGFQ
ncbi:hypothetical protein BWI96_18950 [Siphonobacter sp. SORGH_AS_0500]|uniref:hypothetical protein n=1 Tax=Siphonobacter sp. SORGH_AS_0500 TaxID=1864824 RepID=UPI000CC0912D|nr:hypothetical protein [Siphonobacter sp. SORGH_AS_0500]PKK35133.1 hypothetical protein BWI96_18950 [Siphonobacter sp. SORGH_AS_0500]